MKNDSSGERWVSPVGLEVSVFSLWIWATVKRSSVNLLWVCGKKKFRTIHAGWMFTWPCQIHISDLEAW
jgi:hypothetical protein